MPAASAAVKLKEDASACQKGATIESDAASKQAYKKRAERLSFCMANRKRYEVTCDSVSGKPQEQKVQMRFSVSRNVA